MCIISNVMNSINDVYITNMFYKFLYNYLSIESVLIIVMSFKLVYIGCYESFIIARYIINFILESEIVS